MIFVTVGTQLAFDRMITTVDSWCEKNTAQNVFAQIGPSKLAVKHMKAADFLSPEKAQKLFFDADVIVAHAGMGSILSALKYRKPIVIFPRKAVLGEHRNDHQLATAKWLADRPGVFVAWSEKELLELLDRKSELNSGDGISEFASNKLIEHVKLFIDA